MLPFLITDSLRAGRSGDRIPVEARFSAPVQTGPGVHPASYTMGTGSFPGVKRPGRGVDHRHSSSARVKERVELYLYSPSGPLWPVLG
jgi:DNA-binding sugar fermentation-stimulating protein